MDLLRDLDEDIDPEYRTYLNGVRDQLRASSYRGFHVLEQDMASAFSGGIETNETFNSARENAPALATEFPRNNLGNQLRAVAETIAVRNSLSASRQIFFVGMGGYDTHSAQATSLPRLLGQIDAGVAAFHSAMVELGLTEDVTLFTASEFGRTLAVNGDGTDHGWGGHQFVVGGAVNGGDIYGFVRRPPSTMISTAAAGG